MTVMKRFYLDWSQPALPQAAEHLARRFGQADALDFGSLIVAVPGRRAGRRLLELLVELAERRNVPIIPPRTVTLGELPELLYRAQKTFASHFVQQLAWVKAIREAGDKVRRLIAPTASQEASLTEWLSLGDLLGRVHRELAADDQDFANVAKCRWKGFREKDRWNALAAVQKAYLNILDGLNLWDMQTARLVAIRHRECQTDKEIVLIGTVDLNQTQRLMLDQVADRVTSLIFAPDSMADRFDEHGCILPQKWLGTPLPLPDASIESADSPADQAAAVVRRMAGFAGQYRSDEIVIGVPDERLVPVISRYLEPCGVRSRYGPGESIARSEPFRLLSDLAQYLETRQFAAIAAFVRHPAMHDWLAAAGLSNDWLTALDSYQSKRLPGDHSVLSELASSRVSNLAQLAVHLQRLIQPFTGKAQSVAAWSQALGNFLAEAFGHRTWNRGAEPDRTVIEACETLRDVLTELAEAPAALAPPISGSEAVQIVLRLAEGNSIPALADPDAVEMLGWLELPLDDAPVAIVTGMNEGIVPSSLNADLFLPNGLRHAIGLEDNERRAARDAYSLALLAQSRPRVHLIAGRRSIDGDPLMPSRLLFACDDRSMADRVMRLFQESNVAAATGSLGSLRPGQAVSTFSDPPKPGPLAQPVESMSVTGFRDYLACPYRYYLRHVLRLEAVSDTAEELDPSNFGTLAHEVLEEFGRSETAASTDPAEIAAFLDAELDRRAGRNYDKPLAAVSIQIEQLRLRLHAFAQWQAAWAGRGWQIEQVERGGDERQGKLEVDGKPMFLRGRIDRIDFHPATGRRVVFDYKTSDSPKDPDKLHRDSEGDWIDLQLPLYRHLAAGLGIEGPIQLGYIPLPKAGIVTEAIAPWSESELADADRTAFEVVRKVRKGEFWPRASEPPAFSEDFAAICRDGQFTAPPLAEEDSP